MRHTRALAPYGILSLAIVVASAIALVPTIYERAEAPGAPRAVARVALSDTARLAFWRAAADRLELWVGDLDGRRRWTIGAADQRAEPALTRWSPDGASVAYTSGGALGVAHVDGTRAATIVLPATLLREGWKIVSFEWSPDSSRIAATIRAGNGFGNDSDVYVAPATDGATWLRVTSLGDAYAGRWIDADRLFIETASGVIAVLDVASRELRPLTGMPAASPLVGRDGRVYFVGGRYAGVVVASKPYANGWVWSATIDGDDVRRETMLPVDQVRLFGILADGRAAIGVPGGAYFAREDRVVLAFRAGAVRTVDISGDGRHVIGWTGSRVLTIDPAKVRGATGVLPADDAASILVGDVVDADVWSPRTAPPLAHARPQPSGGPRARFAFQLGRSLWRSEPDGAVRQLAGGGPTFYVSPPRWSPAGDRLAAVVTSGAPASANVVIHGPGGVTLWEAPRLYPAFQWTPDGRALSFTLGGGMQVRGAGPQPTGFSTELRDADTGTLVERLEGRVTWTSAGRVVLSDGEIPASSQTFVRQRVEILAPTGSRPLTDAARLAAEILAPGAPFEPVITDLVPFGDPAYVGIWVWKLLAGHMADGAFAVVRATDGHAVWSLPTTGQTDPTYISDVSASPLGRYVAWTEFERSDVGVRRTSVADPALGRVVTSRQGRFAGWSPDGEWIYVARDEGLYAARIDGSAIVRIGPIGVPVVAARP